MLSILLASVKIREQPGDKTKTLEEFHPCIMNRTVETTKLTIKAVSVTILVTVLEIVRFNTHKVILARICMVEEVHRNSNKTLQALIHLPRRIDYNLQQQQPLYQKPNSTPIMLPNQDGHRTLTCKGA